MDNEVGNEKASNEVEEEFINRPDFDIPFERLPDMPIREFLHLIESLPVAAYPSISYALTTAHNLMGQVASDNLRIMQEVGVASSDFYPAVSKLASAHYAMAGLASKNELVAALNFKRIPKVFTANSGKTY